MVNVGGEPSGRVRETITKDIRDAEVSGPGSKCEFQLKIPGEFFTSAVTSLRIIVLRDELDYNWRVFLCTIN